MVAQEVGQANDERKKLSFLVTRKKGTSFVGSFLM